MAKYALWNEEGKQIPLKPGTLVHSHSPLYSEFGTGVVLDVRGEQAKVEFRPTIFSDPPHVNETKILHLDDLQVVKSPLERLRNGEFEESWQFELRQRAAHLLDCNREGQLSNARTDLLPHQISVAHEVIASPHQRFLIADDVGLGKTIEAGLVYFALKQRGQAHRTLIITPAGLTFQWQDEMEDKFGVPFVVYREDVHGRVAFEHHDHVIASLDTLKLDRPQKDGEVPGHKSLVLGAHKWDLIIFDEAHKLSAKTRSPRKVEKTLNYRLAEGLRDHCDALLLLTATPHQGDDSKFQNLMRLLYDELIFEDWESSSPDATHYTELVMRNRKAKVTDADGRPIFKGIEVRPVHVELQDSGERAFHRALVEYLREGYGYADQDPNDNRRKAIGFVMTTFQKLAASSTRAIKRALTRRRDNLKRQVEVEAGWEEGEYDARCQGESEEQRASELGGAFLQADQEIQWLDDLVQMPVPEDGKLIELRELIESLPDNELVLVFTEYRQTQDLLQELLEEHYGEGCVALINGSMNLYEKHRNQERFRQDDRVRFMVSTEAGGEGINLQFCHIQVNYDLPWNPFRLAQRYGRLYRYGQDKVVQVFNFENHGTIEAKVRNYLEQKTETAAQRIAKITGETTHEIEEGLLGLYDDLLDYESIYRDGLAKKTIKVSQEAIDRAVREAEEAYKLAYHSLFSKSIAPFNPERFKHEIESPLDLEDVKDFVREFVQHHGRNFTRGTKGYLSFLCPVNLQGQDGLRDRYERVTFDRKQAIRNSHLEFMALGHPFTDAAIKHCGEPEFGGFCAIREVYEPPLAGRHGVQFNYLVRRTVRSPDGEQVFFDLVPQFLTPDGAADIEAADAALRKMGDPPKNPDQFDFLHRIDASTLEARARERVRELYEDPLWDEDVSLLNVAAVRFR